MRATVMYKAGDVRIENVPDPKIQDPTDAILSITRACICGSDLWPYKLLEPVSPGRRMGHEAIGVIEAVGHDVTAHVFGSVRYGAFKSIPQYSPSPVPPVCNDTSHPRG